MKSKLSESLLDISREVREALESGQPVLGLESTILSHGMPYPENLVFAKTAERAVRSVGAVPAVTAVDGGRILVGLSPGDLERITESGGVAKTGVRDLAWVLSRKLLGATTVSSTLRIARMTGIRICATGGIGGVHPGFSENMDMSQDIIEMAAAGVLLVSSGAKAILDIPKTLEALETYSIPVVGYQTNSFPVFYSRVSEHGVTVRSDSPDDTVKIFKAHLDLGLDSAIMVANPVPVENEIKAEKISSLIDLALKEALAGGISGKAVTPFLLKRLHELSLGETQTTNQALALNNYKLGAELAVAWSKLNS